MKGYNITNRAKRIADQIQRDIMQVLRTKVKDPQINWVTVNRVEVSANYQNARIYFTVLDKAQLTDINQALEKAKGFIRSELSRDFTTYSIPKLQFIYDESVERSMQILAKINQVSSSS